MSYSNESEHRKKFLNLCNMGGAAILYSLKKHDFFKKCKLVIVTRLNHVQYLHTSFPQPCYYPY
jgi:hypothetical protein